MQEVLLIGAGTMGKEHASAYYAMENVHLTGIVDPRQVEAKKIIGDHDTKIFASLEEAVNELEKIDCVDICVPTLFHKEYVKKAADYGLNIICEKPLAYTYEEAREILEYCKEKQVQLFVAHVVRFFPQYSEARKLVLEGTIGDVGVVRARRGGAFPIGNGDWYRDPQKSGGVILDLMIHDFDYLRWIFGDVERVYAKGLLGSGIQNLDYALVTLTFKSGVIAHVEGTWAHHTFSTQFEFAARTGIIEYDSSKEEPVLLSLRETEEAKVGVAVPQSPLRKSPYFTELEHFIHCLETGEQPIVTAEDACKAVEISNMALKSLQTGKPVILSEGGEL